MRKVNQIVEVIVNANGRCSATYWGKVNSASLATLKVT
jgi:hypothetical protein